MPIYNFECKKCSHEYEDMVSKYDETEKYPGIQCPECGSESKQKLMSAPSFHFSNPIGTDRWTNGGTGHDYRHYWNMEHRVAPERKAAEAASKVGPNPYNDTTKQDIELDGKILDLD